MLYLTNYKKKKEIEKRILQRRFEKHLPPKELRKPNKCWNWTGTTTKGYGQICHQYKILRASRLSYEFYKGKIPEGLIIRHTCDNPSCVNPEHLILGTNQDNSYDMVKRNRCSHAGTRLNTRRLSQQTA